MSEESSEHAVDPKTLRPLKRKDFKQVARLKKGISRFLRYHRDLISEADFSEIEARQDELDAVLEKDDALRIDLEKAAEHLTHQCEEAVPNFKYSALRENLEVFFVAIVLAMAIRAYFAQPSRIPTASMQPTLNGIIAYPADDDYVFPDRWTRFKDKIWHGRSHIEMISDRDDLINLTNSSNWFETQEFKMFPRTTLNTEDGQVFKVPGTITRVERLLNPEFFSENRKLAAVEKGDVIARGYVETGDWVVVDRFTFHWRKPKRDDIFVFTTHGIPGATRDARGEEQHYIKRLCGEPGDHLKIEPPFLYVNGEMPNEFGIRRVIAAENGYPGYQRYIPEKWADIPPGKYIALGDNSRGSSDSRDWGHVPGENIVGRAVAVYFPFGNHFGLVK